MANCMNVGAVIVAMRMKKTIVRITDLFNININNTLWLLNSSSGYDSCPMIAIGLNLGFLTKDHLRELPSHQGRLSISDMMRYAKIDPEYRILNCTLAEFVYWRINEGWGLGLIAESIEHIARTEKKIKRDREIPVLP